MKVETNKNILKIQVLAYVDRRDLNVTDYVTDYVTDFFFF